MQADEEEKEQRGRRSLSVLGDVPPHFFAVALCHEVTAELRSVDLYGLPLVLYRDKAGKVVAHVDRCPHRNARLSCGRLTSDGTLECPYHGWRFNAEGACTEIPGLARAPKASHRVETFPVREAAGIVFVFPRETQPEESPLVPEESEDPAYTCLSRALTFPGSMHAVVENALDVPHTSVLHRGLFRTPKRSRVKVTLRRYQTLAEATFEGEPPPKGLFARLLSLGSKKKGPLVVEHWDRFLLPGILQVEYRLGDAAHLLITGYLSSVSPSETRLFARVCLRTPLPRWLTRWLIGVLEPFAMKVVEQDRVILRQQAETLERFGGPSFMSTEIDVLGASVTRLLKEQALRDEALQGGEIYALRPARDEIPREERSFELDA